MPETLLPTSGAFAGDVHLFPVRVYYEDTDAGGIVYHANYLRYCERARSEMLRLGGVPHADQVAATGVAFAVRHCTLDFLKPARLEETLIVATRVTALTGATATLRQIIRRLPDGVGPDGIGPDDGEELVRVGIKLACITADGRPTRVPAAARAALARWQAAEGFRWQAAEGSRWQVAEEGLKGDPVGDDPGLSA